MNPCSISSMIQIWIHFLTNPFCHLKKQTGIDRPNWNLTSSWYQTWSIWFWNWNWFLIPNTTPDSNWTGWILLSNVKCDLIFRMQTAPLLSVRFIFICTMLLTTVIISAALYRFKVLPPSEQWFSGAQSLQQNKSYFTWIAHFNLLFGLNVMQQRNVLLLSSHRLLVIIKIQYNDASVVRFKWLLWAGSFCE